MTVDVHGITNLLPSTLLHRPRPPRALASVYRALRRVDAALGATLPARALANSLVVLAARAQPSAGVWVCAASPRQDDLSCPAGRRDPAA